MPDYKKDTPRQAALRREIETHAIWQYPPEERLQHNREWQSLYLLVFEFKNFLQKIENRLQNTDASALAQDEEAMLDARRLPAPFYKQLADSLGLDEDALRRLIRNATSARRTFSLNEDGGDNGPAFDMADPGQEDLQLRLERTTEAMRVIALFAGKDIKDYPRLFFTTDVLGPLCAAKPTFPPERYCALLEKQEDLLWSHIFVRGYIDFLFDPAHPARLRVLPDTPLAHPLRDSSVAAYQHVTPAAVSSQRKQYTALLHKMMAQMQG